jgi:hypothetical protein
MTCDFLSLLLQAAGGAIASGANTKSSTDLGVNIMIAGLSFQVASLLLFMVLCGDFAWRVYKAPTMLKNERFAGLRESLKFKAFLYCKSDCSISVVVQLLIRYLRSWHRNNRYFHPIHLPSGRIV